MLVHCCQCLDSSSEPNVMSLSDSDDNNLRSRHNRTILTGQHDQHIKPFNRMKSENTLLSTNVFKSAPAANQPARPGILTHDMTAETTCTVPELSRRYVVEIFFGK